MQTLSSKLPVGRALCSRLLGYLLATLWIVGNGVLSVHADRATVDPTRTQTAFPLDTPPTIDGVIDTAAEWARAGGGGGYWLVQPVATALDGIAAGVLGFGPLPEDPDDLSFNIYAGYDTNYLYIAVRVRDDQPFTDSAEAGSANGNTWQDDSVEVFVDGANANDPAWAQGQVGGQFVITANNAYREAEAGNPGYGPNAAWYAQAVPRDDGSGYDAEFRISLSTLGNPKPGDVIGFTVAVNDDDTGGDRLRQVLWQGEAHKPVTYGNLLLGPRSYTAPLVTNAPVVDGVINLAEYTGATKEHLGDGVGIWDFGGSSDDTFPEENLNYDWWVVHTADAVYVAVNVVDDQIINDSPDAQPGMEDGVTWEDDSVEVFFDSDNTRNLGAANVDFEGQYVFAANGARRDNEARNPTFGSGPADWFAATSRTATGYQVEFRIPKANLQNPTNRFTMGFMVAVNDDNGPDSPLVPGDQLLWFGLSHREFTYGRLTLDGPPTVIEPLRIVEATPDSASGDLALRWEGGTGPLFQVQAAATITGPFEPLSLPQSPRTYIDKGTLKAGKANFYRVQQGATGFPSPRCNTTPGINSWLNTPFANQTGTFTATWDATPSEGAPLDVVMALSSGPKTAFGDFACLVRFFGTSGMIDARNGGAYEAVNAIPFEANVKYTFRVVVNIPAATYSIYVTPAGGAEQTVGIDYAFRPTAGTISNLNNFGIIDDTEGSATVCDLKVVTDCVTTPAINSWLNTPFANQTGTFTATWDATPSEGAPLDVIMALSSGPKTAFGDFACLVRFQTAGIIDARNGGVYAGPTPEIPFSANVQYHFRLVVNIPAQTYSIYVTEAGGAEQLVGMDFAFRPTAGTITSLNNFGIIDDIEGSATICAFKVVP
jgi:hypothetical protein